MRKKMFLVPFAILAMLLMAFLGGEIVLRLWNWLAPTLFGLHTITLWQAFGLLVLCRVLFGGFGFHGHRGRGGVRDKWNSMTHEERDRFREGMRSRCGSRGAATTNPGATLNAGTTPDSNAAPAV